MSYQKGHDHDRLLEGFMTLNRADRLTAVQDALKTALDEYLEVAGEFRTSPTLAQRLTDLVPETWPRSRGSTSVLNIFGVPVRTNPTIPLGEIRVYGKNGNVVSAVRLVGIGV